ncbi:TetR/AcrR family transcriptional regulator [Mycobacterium cookii]|uniref:Putative TetR-family transcriptional regulator n=1 Tax=Mycobacterium cookii TaxID=1775 RepID=A0A7I7L4E1_9MYCO|nr:TetR/AcrR family transcriptional regulator [Mycobacterium cookii]MCV7329484.1 TetR/AcrR family transcriptional regulator [Mycobacterium cookii]BBX48681.1 putative TetR-family transcriptional regulator [Mycobacterium cookii]
MRVHDRLTSATATLMQRHGVAGTGIAQILDTSGVTRRSIYLNFPGGKAELVAAATRSAGDEMAAILRDYVDEPDPVAAFARMWSEVLVSSNFEGGCPIVAAACARDEAPEAAAAAAKAFATWEELLTDRLIGEKIERSVAQSLSTTIVAAVEGAVILSRAARSTKPLEQVSHHLEELIAANRPTARGKRPTAK